MIALLSLSLLTPVADAHGGGRRSCDVDDLLEDYLALFNDRAEDWTGVLDEDYAVESPYGTYDLAGWQALTGGAWAAMPDIQWSTVRTVVQGDRVALEYSFTGTFENDFLGIPATGATVVGRGMEMHRLDRSACRIVETWNYSDAYGFFAQLQ